MLDCKVSPLDRAYQLSTTRETGTTVTSCVGQTITLASTGTIGKFYSLPILSGVAVSVTATFHGMSNYISFRFTMDSCVNCFVASIT